MRFARFLAADGWRAVRFDWRGVGESTGAFDRVGCAEWADDLRAAAALGDGPLALVGVRFGALVARDAFADGLGDALVEWGPPASARAALTEALRRKLAEEMAAGSGGKRTRDDYLAALERGEIVDVDGYGWGLRLWESAGELDAGDAELAGRPRLQDQADARRRAQDRRRRLDAARARAAVLVGQPAARARPRRPLRPHLGVAGRGGGAVRRLCDIETAGGPLAATEHVPLEPGGLALLLLNFGHVARSGVGDLAARTGDALSAQGVTTLRVDLPGLGDTPGDIPADEAAFFRAVQRGDHAALAAELARDLRARSGARAVVVGGLCGGGVTAIYAADRAPSDVDGLLLIEPDYSLVPLAGSARPRTTPAAS